MRTLFLDSSNALVINLVVFSDILSWKHNKLELPEYLTIDPSSSDWTTAGGFFSANQNAILPKNVA